MQVSNDFIMQWGKYGTPIGANKSALVTISTGVSFTSASSYIAVCTSFDSSTSDTTGAAVPEIVRQSGTTFYITNENTACGDGYFWIAVGY